VGWDGKEAQDVGRAPSVYARLANAVHGHIHSSHTPHPAIHNPRPPPCVRLSPGQPHRGPARSPILEAQHRRLLERAVPHLQLVLAAGPDGVEQHHALAGCGAGGAGARAHGRGGSGGSPASAHGGCMAAAARKAGACWSADHGPRPMPYQQPRTPNWRHGGSPQASGLRAPLSGARRPD
jgi:hypothetical protein